MASPTEAERLRQITRFKEDARDFLEDTEAMQRQRWDLLRRVVDDAAWQYTSMRIDSVEERLRDQGAPLWLSCILTIGVTLIPVSVLTGSFLLALTESTQRMLKSAAHARMRSASKLLFGHKHNYEVMSSASETWLRLPKEIKRTEDMVAEFAKNLEPELANTLQDFAHGLAPYLGQQPFGQEADGRKLSQPDAAVVVVKRSLHNWIDSQVRAEGAARRITRDNIRDLFDIATATKPAKEAEAKEAEAENKEAKREPRVPFRTPVQKLPKTYKEALGQLTELREELAPTAVENGRIPDAKDLRDLQLAIESVIWATTYDFTPRIKRENMNRDDPKVRPLWITVVEPAPLPGGLWKRLIERYGSLERLGTKTNPSPVPSPVRQTWSPEVRLSHYFSQILYRQINNENAEMVQRFSALRAR